MGFVMCGCLYVWVCVCVVVCMCGFCNVCMCGCFGNTYTCITVFV